MWPWHHATRYSSCVGVFNVLYTQCVLSLPHAVKWVSGLSQVPGIRSSPPRYVEKQAKKSFRETKVRASAHPDTQF